MVKVAVSGRRGFILGGFNEGTEISLIQRDLKYFKSFAATMEKYVLRLKGILLYIVANQFTQANRQFVE